MEYKFNIVITPTPNATDAYRGTAHLDHLPNYGPQYEAYGATIEEVRDQLRARADEYVKLMREESRKRAALEAQIIREQYVVEL